MKPSTTDKKSIRKRHQDDDNNIRYKLNTVYFNNIEKQSAKSVRKHEKASNDEDVRYKLPTVSNKAEKKNKPKPKIKVNFWSNKPSKTRLNTNISNEKPSNRRHTVAASIQDNVTTKQRNPVVKLKKLVSFLPSPVFSENHVPMVTVPDDLAIQLNEEEALDLGEDLNLAFVNSNSSLNGTKRKAGTPQTSPRGSKRKIKNDVETRDGVNVYDLEYFSKYIVQKLRKMETTQRIYSENLINTVLMMGQLHQLNGKSKITHS